MQFDLQGSDPRFPALRALLAADGHTLGVGGIPISPPSAGRGLPYYRNESYAVRNAALTAEAAVSLLMQQHDTALMAMDILLVGYGRIGRALARRLTALGAHVIVAARRPESRALAECEGCHAVDITPLGGTYDAVVNTVPVPLLHGDFGRALCLDLAGAPGGWNDETPVQKEPGLPGRYAPKLAAQIMRDAIYETVKEENLWKS